jgi:transcriptional regulatory protein LevR
MFERIRNITLNKKVVAIVGTINPEISDIPFISLDELLNNEKMDLIIKKIKDKKQVSNLNIDLKDMFDISIIRVFHYMSSKEEIINNNGKKLWKSMGL